MIERLETLRSNGRDGGLGQSVSGAHGRARSDALLRYRVNLLVSHDRTEGAPVVVETNPTYYNLVGRVEYEGELGNAAHRFHHDKARRACTGPTAGT